MVTRERRPLTSPGSKSARWWRGRIGLTGWEQGRAFAPLPRAGFYSALPLNPARGWGPSDTATPGSVSMVVSAEPSTATNISA